MTHVNRTELDAAGPPPTDWGPGKNAALSLLAFVVVFGMFAYLKGDARNDQSVEPSSPPVAAKTTADGANAYAFVTPAESSAERVPSAIQATPMAPESVEIEPHEPSVTLAPTAAIAAAPRPTPRLAPQAKSIIASIPAPHVVHWTVATHIHAPHVLVAGDTRRAAPSRSDFKHPAYAAALRELAARGPVRNGIPTQPVSQLHPYGTYTRYTAYQQASITHEDRSGAQALETARACAVMDQWQCVEENASRALAIDPDSAESQALLQQAIRNRI